MIEEWRAIPGYDGWYDVSSLGRVRSWKRRGGRTGKSGRGGQWSRAQEPRLMTPQVTHDGYMRILLRNNGVARHRGVHRLMCVAFYGDQPEMQAAHKNDVHDDNRIENLYWATPVENCADRDRRLGSPIGKRK